MSCIQPLKLRLFETSDLDLATVIHTTNQLQLVTLRVTRPVRWVFEDSCGRGEKLERVFNDGRWTIDQEQMADGREVLLWLSHNIRVDKYFHPSRHSLKAIAAALQARGDYFAALGLEYFLGSDVLERQLELRRREYSQVGDAR